VQTISSEGTEFSSNKPDVLEEVTAGVQQSELVGVSSWETSWSLSNNILIIHAGLRSKDSDVHF
jgi:hypothetical protein